MSELNEAEEDVEYGERQRAHRILTKVYGPLMPSHGFVTAVSKG